MPGLRNKIAFVVATKDRPQELRCMLRSFEAQSYLPDQVLIVDGGDQQVGKVAHEFPSLKVTYLRCIPPSAARQRNIGLKAVDPEIDLIGFLDDDVELEINALEAMMTFWEGASEDIGGASGNMVNHPPVYASWLKSLPIAEKLGLYSKDRGIVLPSGFHTMIGYVSEPTFVQWLPTTAVVWRRKIFGEFLFDEWFDGYSYLEDLDFSYRVSKKYQLAIVADAKYYHYPASTGRGNSYMFGEREVTNRIYFVKKHQELSLSKCYLALMIRMFISLTLVIREQKVSYFHRAWGNIVGLRSTIAKTRYRRKGKNAFG